MTREEVTAAIGAAKAAKKVTWQEIAREVGKSSVWTTSVCLGQNRMTAEQADKLVLFLGLPSEASAILQQFPTKGKLWTFRKIRCFTGSTRLTWSTGRRSRN